MADFGCAQKWAGGERSEHARKLALSIFCTEGTSFLLVPLVSDQRSASPIFDIIEDYEITQIIEDYGIDFFPEKVALTKPLQKSAQK